MNKTNFPIWKKITIKKITKEDLEKAGIKISDYASTLLEKIKFKKETVNLVKLKISDLGFTEWTTTDQIYKRAKKLRLELCPASVGAVLRMEYKDQPMNEWLYIAIKQIIGPDGSPVVFRLDRYGDDLWLRDGWAGPGSAWYPGNGIVFRLKNNKRWLMK